MGVAAEALYAACDQQYLYFEEHMWGCWQTRVETFNPGQVTIYVNHIDWMISAYMSNALDAWPWTEMEEYDLMVYSAYDFTVMEQAFSESIRHPQKKCQEIIWKAQDLYQMAEFLEFVGL